MGKLISVHTIPLYQRIWVLPFIGIGLFMAARGIVQLDAGVFLFGLVFAGIPLFHVGLPGRSARHVEIYEEGIIYRTLRHTRTWHWLEFVSFTKHSYTMFTRSSKYNVFSAVNHNNRETLSFNGLTKSPEAFKYILSRVQPVIYQKLVSIVQDSRTVYVNPRLGLGQTGFEYSGQFVNWRAVKQVRMNGDLLIIEGKFDGENWRLVKFAVDSTPNGAVFAELIPTVWQEAINTPQPVEPAYIMIDGIHFNSEGEMIYEKAD